MKPRSIPFIDFLGIETVSASDGRSETRLDLRPEYCNSMHAAHGGALMTLLDVTMVMASRSRPRSHADEEPNVVTIEMKTSFMRPGSGRLTGHGRLVHHTPTLAFCESTVVDADGKLIASASGTFKYIRPRRSES